MGIDVRKQTIEEIEERMEEMNTDLNKINYLESVLKGVSFSFEIKRYLWGKLSELFEDRKMLERAARAMGNKAGVEPMAKDKIDSYITAAELYARIGKIEAADDMFLRATRDSTEDQKRRVKLARKNIYSVTASELESKGKKASAVKFYEKLIKMNLDESEKLGIKHKLLDTYNALGLFREAKLLEGL